MAQNKWHDQLFGMNFRAMTQPDRQDMKDFT
jgi:hypothetical protein